MSEPKWDLSADKKTLTVSFPTNPPASFKLDAGDVEKLLWLVGEGRSAMLPEIPKKPQIGQAVEAIYDPIWHTEREVMTQDTMLNIRHPRFGWLYFVIPRAEAEKLAGYIHEQVKTPTEQPRGKGN